MAPRWSDERVRYVWMGLHVGMCQGWIGNGEDSALLQACAGASLLGGGRDVFIYP